ncbi:hypothetical protein ACVW1A_002335 [Bradyrhizobium sp. LB1.3]
MVLGVAAAGVMDRLAVEAIFQREMLGIVDVALDEAQRNGWALRQRQRQLVRGRVELGVGDETFVTMPIA